MSMAVAHYVRGKSPEALVEAGWRSQTVGAILTDPPYSTGSQARVQYGRRQKRGIPVGEQFIENDVDLSQLTRCLPFMRDALHPLGVAMVFGAPTKRYDMEQLLRSKFDYVQGIVWDKGAPGLTRKLRWAMEDIYLCGSTDPWEMGLPRQALISPLRCPRINNPLHPNQKPVKLLRQLLNWALPPIYRSMKASVPPMRVLDLFAGVGSVSVAALGLGMDSMAVESDPQWWDDAERRIAEAQGRTHHTHQQHSLLLGEGNAEEQD